MLAVPIPIALAFLTSPLLHGWMELAERYPTKQPSMCDLPTSRCPTRSGTLSKGAFTMTADCCRVAVGRRAAFRSKTYQRPEGRWSSKHHGGPRSYYAATFVRSPTSMDAPFCMTHVLTVVCSMCVLRMSFSTSFHRPSATSHSGTQVSTSLETDVPRCVAPPDNLFP